MADQDVPTSTNEEPTAAANGELAAARADAREYLEGWKRAKADLANFKREEIERVEGAATFAAEELVRDLLVVVDSFDVGLTAVSLDTPAGRGLVNIKSQLETVLERWGLGRFEVPLGTPFDPTRHEAVGEAPGVGPPGTVAQEVAAGYLLHGRVLRPARVLVVKHSES